ncbi:gliding motility-associated C-terminal domain-containing protein [Flavobacterium sp. LM5]|uniref:T9SS type B sorting domain-containing protein n=1 Tax=Flavobacterium sp. LM5 TaxID=1938610 RepID=UPI0016711564|nr:gliding motility-associated C-terminal domain-containing protein [Flavobacterium sp. LM5]
MIKTSTFKFLESNSSLYKNYIFLLLLLTLSNNAYSQFFTDHYIAPAPWQYFSKANEIIIATNSTSTVNITLKKSDGTVITNLTATKGSPAVYRFSGLPNTLPIHSLNTIINAAGIIVTSSGPTSVNLRNVASDELGSEGNDTFIKGNASLTSFGDAGIGVRYRIGYYRNGNIAGTERPTYSIMAINNGTTIKLNGSVLTTLNAGQSYLFQAEMGSLVESSNGTVMNTAARLDQPSGCGDGTFDQIPPEAVLGTEYFIQKGKGNDTAEQTTIVATKPNTAITINSYSITGALTGTTNATLANAGDFYTFVNGVAGTGKEFTASRIFSTENIAVYSGTAQSCEVDISVIAPVSACGGSNFIETYKFRDYVDDKGNVNGSNNDPDTVPESLPYFGYVLLNDATAVVNVNGTNIETLAGARYQLGTTGWYLINFTNDEIGSPEIISVESTAKLTVSIVQQGGGFSMAGFFSNFAQQPDEPTMTYISGGGCVNNSAVLTTPVGFAPYQWYYNGVAIPGATSNTYTATQTGSYSLASTLTCGSLIQSKPVTVTLCADLEVLKTVNLSSPCVGSNVEFTVKVTNKGPNNTSGLVVNDLLPTGYTYVSSIASVGTYNSTTGVWSIGNLINAQVVTLKIVATVKASGIYLNTASIPAGSQPDNNNTNDSASISITPIALPTALVLTGSTICVSPGGNGTVSSSTSANGVTYQLYNSSNVAVQTAKSGTGSALIWSSLPEGNGYYVVSTSNPGACTSTSATVNITTISNPNTPTVSTITQPTCTVATGSFQITGYDATNTYTFTPAVVSISGIGVVTANAGTYTFKVRNAAGCISLVSSNIVVKDQPELPTTFAIIGGGAYCSGGTGVEVGLANSQSGINYQLQLEGGNIGTAVAGTGSAISFGKKTAAGTYTIVATNATTGCIANMTGSVVVTINSLPAVPTLPVNVTVCETGSLQTLTATATVPSGSSIVWYDAAIGGNVVNPPTLVSTTAATRTLYGQTSNGTCSSSNRTAVTLTILAAPGTQFATTSDITVACGAVTTSTLSYSNNSTTCPISGSVTSTLSAIPSTCGGPVTESWTFTDQLGRTISKTRTITVSPAALPTMTAPADITVACGALPAPSTISYSNGLTGGCEISGTSNASTFTATPNSCGGTVTETWTATDTCGRALASVSRTITVSPAALPTMTAPADITVACGSIPSPSTLSFSNGLTGGCEISGTSNASTFTATPNSCGGTVTETWTATDTCGRALASVSRTITVSPAALPTMTAPADITVACGSIPSPSTLSFSNGLTGGCEISGTSNASTFTATPNSCGGTVTETWTATDTCGRALASVSRTITVSPAALPTMTAPADITVACGALPTPSAISYSNGLTGGCEISGTSNASTFSTTPNSCGGTVTETWTATDTCGRALASVSRTITVSPAALSTMTAPADITVACGALPAPSTISYSNGLTGGCEISGTSNASTFSTTPNSCGGTVTETWTATDTCGRALASVSRTITVSPAALSTMTAPADITVACGALPAPSTLSFSNGLTGGCEISGTSNASTFSTTPNSCGGTVTETWTATDTCGRALASVSRTITVSPAALSTMTAPADITVACGALPSPSTLSFSNGLTGGCEISGTSNVSTFSTTPNSCGGTVTETWTATDTCGRALASVSRTITVSPAALSTMTAPADITVACGALPAPSTLSFSNGLTGGCEISGTSNASTFSTTPNSCGGTVTETWTATDTCGRALASVSRTITVSPAALSTMTAPADITVACGALPAPSTLSFSNGLTGGCEISGTSNVSTFSTTPNSCGGTVTETWTATDTCGRALASVSRTITVSPAALSTMTAPADITVACGALPAPSTISYSNGLTGGCEISGTSNASTFSTTPNSCGGTVTETWTATDTCGRALASVSRTITVSPAALPTMTAPADITVACGALPTPSAISYSNGLTGGCEISGTSNASTFSTTPNSCGGTVTETWTATDTCGRALASVSRTITVSPAALSTMTAPADITVACGALPAPSTISYSNGLTGGCEISGTSNASTFTATPNSCGGTVTETWTATDTCGRALASVSRMITIQDTTAPTWNISANALNITLECGDLAGLAVAQSQAPTATDNCEGTVMYTKTSGSFTVGSCRNSGTYTNTWIAKDSCGNSSATFTQVITIQDITAPTFVEALPTDVTVECSSVPIAPIVTATDNCGIATVAYTETTTAGACSGSYTLIRTWIAKDTCGLTTTHVQTITVQDTMAPVITSCASNQTIVSDADCKALVPDFTKSIVVADNCTASNSLIITQSPTVGSLALSGSTTITLTIEDSCGNKTTCEANLLVTNFIVANDDIGSPVNGNTGGISFTNVLSSDLLNCKTVNTSDVLTSFVNATNLGITLDGTNVVVAAGTPAGNYTLTYQICEILNPTNCATATVTVVVNAPIIDAVTETTTPVNGLPGGTTTALTANDTLNGLPVVVGTAPGNVSVTPVSVPTGLTLNADGTVTVGANTPAGTYPVEYTICEVTNPSNCDTVISNVVVSAAQIIAKNDEITVDSTLNPLVLMPFSKDYGSGVDTLNGVEVTFDQITVTVTDIVLPGGQSFPVPKVDSVTKEIVIPASVPAGVYTIFYTICEKLNPTNCSNATIKITVKSPVIISEDDILPVVNGASGSSNAGNVLVANAVDPDRLNGVAATINLVNITVVSPASRLVSGGLVPFLNTATGIVEVPSGTPAGTYTIVYAICDKINPTVCDQSTVTVVVNTINAIQDNTVFFFETVGGISSSVLLNDTVNRVILTPSTFNTVTLTGVSVPSGLTLNADGTITVPSTMIAGVYDVVYEICTKTLPVICSRATMQVIVQAMPAPAPPSVFADDDKVGPIDGIRGVKNVLNVFENDFIELIPATTSNVIIAVITPDPMGSITLNPDGSVDVKAGTPSGTYAVDYEICTKKSPIVCDQATVRITVVAPIITATNDDYSNQPINSSKGAVLDVLVNDRINNGSVNSVQVVLSIVDSNGVAGVSVDAQGKITIPVGTPVGSYVLTYSICDVINPNNCATATVTIVVKDPCDFDDSDSSCDILVHNAFSPNNDGDNQVFTIDRIENYPENTVEIYNRWGVLVFEVEGYDNTSKVFVGISEGRVTVNKADALPNGTYYYVVKYKKPLSGVMKQKAGFLYLSR